MGEEKTVADVVVVGAGVIGLSIALEMERRGARVMIVERGEAMLQASMAAAGMLAMDDPGNPPELLPLARMSVGLYPEFLRRIEALSGMAVPFQTETALQYAEDGNVMRLAEWSVDPRQLGAALVGAVRATSISLLERAEIAAVEDVSDGIRFRLVGGVEVVAENVVYATGAWTQTASGFEGMVIPRKGQMLRVRGPEGLALREVHRNERVYVVPRTTGPQAGTALIGATVEDVGFDVSVHAGDLARLRGMAAELVPELASELDAPQVEAWAGLRPATRDGLPVLGAVGTRRFVASGHYRNGVLLAPATAVVMADLLMGERPGVEIGGFAVERFTR
jgi:glycine oxidase